MDYESDQDHASLNSIVQVRACEIYPKKAFHTEDVNLVVPFPLLYGEGVEYLGRATEGVIALSNYRLFIHARSTFYNISLGLIEAIECREIFFLYIYCKDARTLRCTFSTNEQCLDWYRRLVAATSFPRRIEDVFALAFHAYCSEESKDDLHLTFNNESLVRASLRAEVERMGFNLRYAWRISTINDDYSLCSTYPRELLVPTCIGDEDLKDVASFRSSRRIPAIVWRHKKYGSIIARCSQPEVGWFGRRNSHDENLIKAIAAACASDCGGPSPAYRSCCSSSSSSSTNSMQEDWGGHDQREEEEGKYTLKKVLIVDARSYAAAVTNRAKGGGCECPEYYPNCEIQFMSLANIHSIRSSFQSVRQLCATPVEQSNWFSGLESTKWLHHMAGLLKAALTVVNAVDRERRPVVVHCSDGWDRTPQIVALAELMLDPYYRSMEGFEVLVKKEWLDFGHKFGDRCGHGLQADDANERCPIFLQWLDCVYQVLSQRPCSFEFNELYLVKLAQHTYSCLFGTFLCNSCQERQFHRVHERTYSVWTFLNSQQSRFRNFLYSQKEKVLRPDCQVRDMKFWSTVYLQGSDSTEDLAFLARSELAPVAAEKTSVVVARTSPSTIKVKSENKIGATGGLVKTRSYDDLLLAVDHASDNRRRSSDPNVAEWLRGFPVDAIELACQGCKQVVGPECASLVESLDVDDVESKLVRDFCKHTICNGSEGSENCSIADESSSPMTRTPDCVDLPNGPDLPLLGPSAACESSTDTLVGDLVCENRCEFVNGSCSVEELQGYAKEKPGRFHGIYNSVVPRTPVSHPGRLFESVATIGTSTSDLSDSCICRGTCRVRLPLLAPLVSETNGHVHQMSNPRAPSGSSKCPFCTNGNRRKLEAMLEAKLEDLRQHTAHGRNLPTPPAVSTPLHSRTPSSGFPATPNDDRLSDCAAGGHRCTSGPVPTGLWGKFDLDGFTLLKDEVQQRLTEIIAEQQGTLQRYQQALRMAQLVLLQNNCQRCSTPSQPHMELDNETCCSIANGDAHSHGHESSASSDLSWEHVDEKEAQPTLWVPDHAVNRCTRCDTEFWLGRRKHHCRKCGKIFCADCSSQMVPIPSEQLYCPVRVCWFCFDQLRCRQTCIDVTKMHHKTSLTMSPALN